MAVIAIKGGRIVAVGKNLARPERA